MTSMKLWRIILCVQISSKIGHAMAEAYDKKIFRTIALAAREAHPITAAPGPEPGGSIINLGQEQRVQRSSTCRCFLRSCFDPR